MAYGVKYRAGYSSKNVQGYIYIDLLDYTGSVTDLVLVAGSDQVKYNFGDWNDPIIGLTASFEIVNNGSSFFDLLPLLTAEERQYRIRFEQTSPSTHYIFTGFLNCDTNEVTYLRNRPIRLNASSYLSKLQYVKPALLETLENRSLIDFINECLALTGSTDPIRVNSKLYQYNDTLPTGHTLFNRCGLFTEIFWKNNVDRDTALDIVKKILEAFDCYIYWYANSWYIERYEDIWNSTQNYVIYTSGSSYEYADPGSTAQTTDASVDIQSLDLVDQSQTIQMIAGLKEIEVRKTQQTLFNLTVNDFLNAADVSTGSPTPGYRTWLKWSTSIAWSLLGQPYKTISNGIKRVGSQEVYKGLYTRFKLTKDAATSLTIKWKFVTFKGSFGSWTGDWSDYTFEFYWYLRDNTGVPSNYYIWENPSSGWARESGTEATHVQKVTIEGTEFDDANVAVEISLTIPLGDTTGLSDGDKDLVFCLGTELVKRSGVSDVPAYTAYIGDVVIQASGIQDNNNIQAVINTNFLDKKEITLEVYDVSNVNIKNGIFHGSAYTARTTTWTTNGTLWESLARRILRNKFQLYNRSRQRLTTQAKTYNKYKPLAMFTDSEQSGKKFLLTAYTYRPSRDLYDMELSEYDNTETINFI
jgi:hypothetical protein